MIQLYGLAARAEGAPNRPSGGLGSVLQRSFKMPIFEPARSKCTCKSRAGSPANKVDRLGLDFHGDPREIENGAREAVEHRDDDLVTITDAAQSYAQRVALLAAGAALLLFEKFARTQRAAPRLERGQ